MRKLIAVYHQTDNGRWDAHIAYHTFISVVQAEDLETARVILRIITAEEMGASSKRRVNWDIVSEQINYYTPDDETKQNLAKGLLC